MRLTVITTPLYISQSIKKSLVSLQCPADTEGLESLDIFREPIPDGVELQSLK